jgi:hypothetical protein
MKGDPMMGTSRMTHERVGRLLAGVVVIASLGLAYVHHPLWLLGVAGTALNLVLSAITDRCAVKSLLIRMGLPGERDLGRAEARAEAAARRAPVTVRRRFASAPSSARTSERFPVGVN